jgi:hypothetical protein
MKATDFTVVFYFSKKGLTLTTLKRESAANFLASTSHKQAAFSFRFRFDISKLRRARYADIWML